MKKKKIGIGIGIGLLIAAVLSFAAVGAVKRAEMQNGVTVLTGVDAAVLTSRFEGERDLFASPEVLWTGVDGTDVLSVNNLSSIGGRVFEGSRSLLAMGEGRRARIHRQFEGVLPDQTGSSAFTFSVFLAGEGEAKLSLTLLSSIIDVEQSNHRLRIEKELVLARGVWTTVLVDISDFAARSSIQELELEAEGTDGEMAFALDAVGFLSGNAPERALMYLSGDYVATDGVLAWGETMVLRARSGRCSFAAASIPTLALPQESAVVMEVTNPTGFKTVTMAYTAETGESYTVERGLETSSSAVQYVYFPLNGDSMQTLSFLFEGGGGGNVSIRSISLTSFPVGIAEKRGEITACTFDASKSMLEISGTLSSVPRTGAVRTTLAVYEMTLTQDMEDLTNGYCVKLASTTSSDGAFSFRVMADARALTRKYAVAAVRGNEIVPIGEAMYVQNPEALAISSFALKESESKKGSGQAIATVYDGIAFTAIPVRLEEILTLDRGQTAFIVDGENYYYRGEVLKQLDGVISQCTERGIRALLVLTVSESEDAALNRVLMHPQAKAGAMYSAFNTESDEGIRYLRAAVDMLARRYRPIEAGEGGVLGFVVGSNVNDMTRYSMGDATLSAFVHSYASALRVVWGSARAVSGGYEVYASLDSLWNGGEGRREAGHYGARSVLDALDELITAEGNFGWQVAFDPYPSASYLAYDDKRADMSNAASRVTGANLEVLSGYLSRSRLMYGQAYREIVLLERFDRIPEGDAGEEYKRGADYAYTYYKIVTPNFLRVKALIVNHDVSYGDTFRLIDTNRSAEATAYALEVIGVSSWQNILTAFRTENAAVRVYKEGNLTHQTPSSVVGDIPLWRFDDKQDGNECFLDNGQGSLTAGLAIGDNRYLSVDFRDLPQGGGELVLRPSKVYDFTLTPYLRFSCAVSGLKEEVSSLTLTVSVMAGKDVLRTSGRLIPGEMTVVVVDMTEFDSRMAVDGIRIGIVGETGDSLGSPTMLVGQIDGLSDKYAGDELLQEFDKDQAGGEGSKGEDGESALAVILLSALLVLLVLIEGTRTVLRLTVQKKREM